MKKNIVSILAYSLLGLSTIMVSCGSDSKSGESNKVENVASEMAFLRVDVSGMTCAIGCAKPIEKMLNETEGVSSAEIDFDKKAAFINYDKSKVTEAALIKAISEFKDGSYSAKISDKNCKSDCKKTCCASKEAKKETKKPSTTVSKTTKGEAKDVSTENMDKIVKDAKSNAQSVGSKTLESVSSKANKTVTKASKEVSNAKNKAIKTSDKMIERAKQNVKASTNHKLQEVNGSAKKGK